eukprot:6956928-Alexandrium_andersonii.AAC.1
MTVGVPDAAPGSRAGTSQALMAPSATPFNCPHELRGMLRVHGAEWDVCCGRLCNSPPPRARSVPVV